ncbi:hypothetical protein A4H97_27730 [Niastella yeongjuensis]|uniref:Uncharacterized protein n=1 Tax=Niastella yeongjuensis TaxID=354355 RepID=A0A1V9EZ73_9BACT|nr:hypothetical protein [Niastella yeongjuensis]OQP51368.1 hypothetical protein A4H97_27730 [Niastella yeongjuensis]SEP38265.1 hypothetical protein SAMN05660816_05608 [Niastella yeongjuensis]
MDNQPTIEQHHTIFVATLDYLLEKSPYRVIIDQHDDTAERYDKLKQRAEKHYRNGNLPLLQRLIREIAGLAPLFKEEGFLASMRARTGYEADIVTQSLPAGLSKRKRNEITINDPAISYKQLAALFSPDNKRKIKVWEASSPDFLITGVDLQFGSGTQTGVYMVDGVDLDIEVYWEDNNTVVIETRADYFVRSKHGERYQSQDDVVRVVYVVR